MSERAAQLNHSRPLIISCLRHGKSSSCLLIPRPGGGGLIEGRRRGRAEERGLGERMKRYSLHVVSVRVACLLKRTARLLYSIASLSFVFRFFVRGRLVPPSRRASRCLLVLRIVSVPSSSCRASRFIHLVKRLVSIRLVFIVLVLFPPPFASASVPGFLASWMRE